MTATGSPHHLLDVTDLSADELTEVLTLAGRPIAALGRPLDGLGVALIFEKPSNRTRQSMEMAVFQLGGHPVYTRDDEVGFDRRETVEDVTRIMEGYHAVLAARVFRHEVVERMAAVASVPVVNMLSDRSHPAPGPGRRAHHDAGHGPAERPDGGLGRRLQQRRPLPGRGLGPARPARPSGLPAGLRRLGRRSWSASPCSAPPASSSTPGPMWR